MLLAGVYDEVVSEVLEARLVGSERTHATEIAETRKDSDVGERLVRLVRDAARIAIESRRDAQEKIAVARHRACRAGQAHPTRSAPTLSALPSVLTPGAEIGRLAACSCSGRRTALPSHAPGRSGMRQAIAVLSLSLAVGIGCAPIMIKQYREDLGRRASFDLSCPQQELQMTVLKEIWNGRETQIGVSGCSKKATYYLDKKEQWIKDSVQQ